MASGTAGAEMNWRRQMKKQNKWVDILIVSVIAAMTILQVYDSDLSQSSRKIVSQYDDSTKISLGWWGNDERHVYTLQGVDLFEQKHPDISVSSQYSVWSGYERRYRIYMMSGTEPDVMLVNYNWLQEYSPDGTGYYDLNDLSSWIDLSAFTEEEKKSGMVNGHLNALPTAYNAVVFYYNQDILDHYGLEVPKTWEDLEKAAEVMYPDGIYPLYINEKHLFLTINAYYEQRSGAHAFAEDGTYIGGTNCAEAFLSFYEELVDRHVIKPMEENDSDDFQNGKTAGAAFWASDADRYCGGLEKNGYRVTMGSPLRLDDADHSGWYVKPATMFAIKADTAHPEEAAELLDFLLNDPDMARLTGMERGVPVSADARAALSESELHDGYSAQAGNEIIENLNSLQFMNPVLENEAVIKSFRDICAKYRYGKEDLNAAAEELAERWSQASQS